MNDEHNIILKDNRIVLPKVYHGIAVKLAHQGHQGLVKSKSLLRSKSFFIGMDKMVEHEISNCIACQAITKQKPPAPLQPSTLPEKVWETVNIDYLGPFPNGKYVFALMDQRSKYPVAVITRNTSANNLIYIFDSVFAHFGFPENVISDNGPPFKSHAIHEYMKSKAINHRRITPLWPQANGEIERFMTSLSKIIQAAHIEGKDWEEEMLKFLMAYRVTPHSATKVPPADMIYNRKIRYSIPEHGITVDTQLNEKANENDMLAKAKTKAYQDVRRHAVEPTINPGDRVLVKQRKANKLTPRFNPNPYYVTNTKGTLITARNSINNHNLTRNATYFKQIPETAETPRIHIDTEVEGEYAREVIRPAQGVVEPDHRDTASASFPNEHERKTYPKRTRTCIADWKRYGNVTSFG